MQVRRPHRARDAGRPGHEEQRRHRDPERVRQPQNDGRDRLDRRSHEEERRAATAEAGRDADDLIPADRRKRNAGVDDPGDPDRVGVEQREQVRLRRVEGPHDEPHLEEGREHEEAEPRLPPAELDAGARAARDLAWQLRCSDPTRVKPKSCITT